MNRDLLDRYETAMRQKRILEADIEAIKKEVIQEVIDNGQPDKNGKKYSIGSDSGNFIVTSYKVYTYSREVERATLALKALKQKEIDDKIAQAVEKNMLMFKQR